MNQIERRSPFARWRAFTTDEASPATLILISTDFGMLVPKVSM